MDSRDFSDALAAKADVVARLGEVDSPEARDEVAAALWDTGCMLQLSGQLEASAAAFDELLRFTSGRSDEADLFDVVEDVLMMQSRTAEDAGREEEAEMLKGRLAEHRSSWARPPQDLRSVAELYAAAEEHSDNGRPAEALSVLAEALRPYDVDDVTPSAEDLPWVIRSFALLGSMAEHHQQSDQARAAYDEALRFSADIEDEDVRSVAEWTEGRRAGLPSPPQ